MHLFGSRRSPAWKVYAQELGGMGYGHPMWHPDPPKKCSEVELGDIGYLDRGRFHLLFNCTRPREDGSHEARGERLPDNFEPFEYDIQSVQGPVSSITDPELISRSSWETKISGEVGAGPAVAPVTGGVTHDAAEDSMASLRLHVPAKRTHLDCRGAIEQYMAKHCRDWLKFFNSAGFKLAQKDIVFVYGFTTTSVWQVSAWNRQRRERGFSLRLLGECLAGVTTTIGFSRKRSHSVSPTTNTGPEGRTFGDGGLYAADQCVFLDFGKTKTRHVVAHRAKTGMQRLKECLCCHCCTSASSFDEPSEAEPITSASDRYFDPVDALLDFILETSDVPVAFATYEDLYPLCVDGRLPADILTAAKERALPIVVINGVGRVRQEPDVPSKSERLAVTVDKAPEQGPPMISTPSAQNTTGNGRGAGSPASRRKPRGELHLS